MTNCVPNSLERRILFVTPVSHLVKINVIGPQYFTVYRVTNYLDVVVTGGGTAKSQVSDFDVEANTDMKTLDYHH